MFPSGQNGRLAQKLVHNAMESKDESETASIRILQSALMTLQKKELVLQFQTAQNGESGALGMTIARSQIA